MNNPKKENKAREEGEQALAQAVELDKAGKFAEGMRYGNSLATRAYQEALKLLFQARKDEEDEAKKSEITASIYSHLARAEEVAQFVLRFSLSY